MALSDAVFGLYTWLKRKGILEDIDTICELGSQTVWVQERKNIAALFEAFGQPLPEDCVEYRPEILSSRRLHEALGFKRYDCIDVDGAHGALKWDLNRKECDLSEAWRYDLVTNHGTAEHVFNQANVFRLMHDLCRPGGLILNVSPLFGWYEHGFFNYHPNFFQAIANANGYEMEFWFNKDPHPALYTSRIEVSAGENWLLITLFRKTKDTPFVIPMQAQYEQFASH